MMLFTVINFISVVILFLWATWCVLYQGVRDGIVGKILFSCVAISALAIILHDIQGTYTAKPSVTLHACMAAVAVRHFIVNTVWKPFFSKLFHK